MRFEDLNSSSSREFIGSAYQSDELTTYLRKALGTNSDRITHITTIRGAPVSQRLLCPQAIPGVTERDNLPEALTIDKLAEDLLSGRHGRFPASRSPAWQVSRVKINDHPAVLICAI